MGYRDPGDILEPTFVRSYTLKSTLIMTTIDFTFMAVLCYALGLLTGAIPEATYEYWRLAGLLYAAKTAVWLFLRIPLLLPIDRWQKNGAPSDENEPALIRSIYYFPYDFSVFYGFLVLMFYLALIGSLVYGVGSLVLSERIVFPGVLFGLAIGLGAVAIGVPVNLLLTAKFSEKLAERNASSFSDIPGKPLSLQVKVGTVAIALGCAPSLLLFSVQNLLQLEELHREADRTGEAIAVKIKDESSEGLDRWLMQGVYPFEVSEGAVVFRASGAPGPEVVDILFDRSAALRDQPVLRERRAGYAVNFTPGSGESRGVLVAISEPSANYLATALVLLLACLWPLLTSMLTVWTIVKPVAVLGAIFHRIIGRGRTEGSDRVPIYYKDEVGRLAFNTNRTIGILTEARRQLEKNSQDLELKNRELQEAYRTKGEFLANMSHELRTPLNAIIGFSRLMKRKLGATLPERQAKNLDMIEQSGEQLLVLVNDLLDFEKIEAGKLNVRREETDLKALLESLNTVLRPLADEKGLGLVFEVSQAPERLFTDSERLRQILTNLLTNSIKYSDSGVVSLEVSPRDEGKSLLFRVSDQGIGMAQEQLARIFDPFHQVDGSETRERGGVGLGLAIVGRLVELLSGTVEVSSVKGVGSSFTVVLPVTAGSEHLLPLGSGPKVLVVDDNSDFLESIHAELSEAGFRVSVADSGRAALESLELEVPRVIITDIVMPEMDGWEFLRRVRERPGLSQVPIVVTSVVDEKPIGLDLEIAGWLTKPFDFANLSNLLANSASLFEGLTGEVLIVEDDPHTAQLLQQSFEDVGLTAMVVGTEEEALAAMSGALPAAVVLDLQLRQGSGWQVLSGLKELDGHERTRVFVYTASDLEESERRTLQDGLVTIVHKHGHNSLKELVASIVGDERES